MITLTAKMRIKGENPLPFSLGVSELGGGALFGETVDVEVVFDRRNLLSLESNAIDRSDIQLPSFGIISNGGSLSFKDNNSRFLGYANVGLLKENQEIEIFLKNTLTKSEQEIGTYYAYDWNYDNDSRSVSVSFKDDLEEMQDLILSKIEYDFEKGEAKNLSWFYNQLRAQTPTKYGFPYLTSLDIKTKDVLNKTYIKYPYMEGVTLWSAWQKLCEAALLHIYKKNKSTVCKYNGGN